MKQYNCPECGEEMEIGYVLAKHSFRWAKNKKQGRWFAIDAEPLTPFSEFGITTPRCDALRCRKCELVIFKYWGKGKQEKQIDDLIEKYKKDK